MTKDEQPAPEAIRKAVLRSEIEELVVEYAYRLDRGDFAGVVDLFTEDCEVHSPRPPFHEHHWEVLKGKKNLAASYEQPAWANPHRTMRHFVSNLRLSPLSETEVAGTLALIGYRDETEGPSPAMPLMIGDYEDIYRKEGARPWRIAKRKVVISFLAPSLIGEDYPDQWGVENS